MTKFSDFFKNHNWNITFITLILQIISIGIIFSTTYEDKSGLIKKQLLLVLIGYLAYFSISNFNHKWLKEKSVLMSIYAVTIGLLVYVKFFTQAIAQTNRWIDLGIISIQPAEFAKITIILLVSAILTINAKSTSVENIHWYKKASFIEKSNSQFQDQSLLMKSIIISILTAPILYLILVQPALGNTLITISIIGAIFFSFINFKRKVLVSILVFFTVLIIQITLNNLSLWMILLCTILLISCIYLTLITKTGFKFIIPALLLGIIIIPSSTYVWNNILKDYQKLRVESFIDPTKDIQGSGWQVYQSQIAIGSGRMFGKGFMQGTQSSLGILPYAHTDFAFASFAEQFGFVGSTFLLLVILTLPYSLITKIGEVHDLNGKLVLVGVSSMLLIHVIINIGMNLGKMPVTGITLPLVSYGGSAVLVNMIALGIVQNILNNQEVKSAKYTL